MVSVPVLSLAITVQLPRLSTALSFFTITFFLAILLEPMVRAIVSAKGKPSGIAETASAITDKNTVVILIPFTNNKIAISIETINMAIVICLENLAILPISVLLAVSTTIHFALPVITLVPAYNIFFLSVMLTSLSIF